MLRRPSTLFAVGVATIVASSIFLGLASEQPTTQPSQPATQPSKPATQTPPAPGSIQDRIAKGLVERSPIADPADPKARDAAAERLAAFDDFINAIDGELYWGGFDETKGYDPAAHKLTKFHPMVWCKVYLSTFMFTGTQHVHDEGQFKVLEVGAKFRTGLDNGDYPYPFWHSPKKWQAYHDTIGLVFVFQKDRLIAAYRRLDPAPTTPRVAKQWDDKWYWTDDKGQLQPHVALFSYFFSKENPHAKSLDTAYRNLEAGFRAQNCGSCHEPSNIAQAGGLVILNYPNQALAGRHLITRLLRENKMPPKDEDKGTPEGIHDQAALKDLIALAEAFENEADSALAFEADRRLKKAEAPK